LRKNGIINNIKNNIKNMQKKIIGSLVVVFSVLLLSGCGAKKAAVDSNKATSGSQPAAEDLCAVFTKESVATITGLDISSTDLYSDEGSNNSNCRYFISTKKYAPIVSIGKYAGDAAVEKAKYDDGKTFKGWKTGTDARITMDHFITYNEGGKINDIFLISGKNEYYRISLYSLNVINDDQLISLASQVAQKISGK
jgi:hypothetical protein